MFCSSKKVATRFRKQPPTPFSSYLLCFALAQGSGGCLTDVADLGARKADHATSIDARVDPELRHKYKSDVSWNWCVRREGRIEERTGLSGSFSKQRYDSAEAK